MLITTLQLLAKLEVEKEENSFVSSKLLDKTILWIEKFKTFPDINFDLDGDSKEDILTLLERNKAKISQIVFTYKNTKLMHGPHKKALNDLKKNHVTVYFTDADFAKICNRAGTNIPMKKIGGDTASRKKLADYLRNAAFGSLPPRIPEINSSVWTELAPVVSNLNQIARKLNKGMVVDGLDILVFEEIKEMIIALRKQLRGVES